MENYYKILEVEENASGDEIKKAFRKMSLKHHPDKTGGSSEKFSKINEAYSVLSDENERKQYDMKRKYGGRMPGINMNGMPFGMGGIPQDFLNHIFGNMNGGINMNMGPGGPNVRVYRNGVPVNQNNLNRPFPIVKHIEVSLEESYVGVKKCLEIERWIEENHVKRTETEKIYVDIPKGTDNNELFILKHKGNILNEHNKGDIKVFIKIVNNSDFERQGLNLIYKKNLSLREALCGFKFNLKLLNGKTVTINNSDSVIKPGYEKAIQGFGMERENSKGSLILKFNIEFPEKLNEEQKKLVSQGLE